MKADKAVSEWSSDPAPVESRLGTEGMLTSASESITRAEAMTTINRVLGRLPETADDLLDDMIAWPDNPPDAWYYLAVQEATNSHDYERKADTVHETWTGLQPAGNWAQYQ